MKKLFLIRHGQDTDNAAHVLNGHRDTSLSKTGVKQARDVAQKMKTLGLRVNAVYTSPLKRARDTAHIVADEFGSSPVRIHPDLIERDYGPFTGRPIADIKTFATTFLEKDGVTYPIEMPGAEGYPAIMERATRFLDEIRTLHPDQHVVAVTHAAIGRMIRAASRGWTIEQAFENPRFDNGEIIELS